LVIYSEVICLIYSIDVMVFFKDNYSITNDDNQTEWADAEGQTIIIENVFTVQVLALLLPNQNLIMVNLLIRTL